MKIDHCVCKMLMLDENNYVCLKSICGTSIGKKDGKLNHLKSLVQKSVTAAKILYWSHVEYYVHRDITFFELIKRELGELTSEILVISPSITLEPATFPAPETLNISKI